MRYIAKKQENDYEVTHLKECETIEGKKVEVIIGKNIINKEKIEKSIANLKEEKVMRIEQMENDIADLEAILEAINLSK